MSAPVVTENLFHPEALEDPYPGYARLRAAGPVHWLPDQQLYLVVHRQEIRQVLDDPATFSSNLVGLLTVGGDGVGFLDATAAGAVDVLATADPPVHTEQRRTVSKPFGPANIRALTATIDEFLRPRIADLVADGGGDWMRAVAVPLPVHMIGRLLGLPAADAVRLTAWSDAAIELLSGMADTERMMTIATSIVEFMGYLREQLIAAGIHPVGGVIDTLTAAVAAEQLTEPEAVAMLVQLVTAGTESTTSLIGSAARILAADPALAQRLRTEPELIGTFVEEVLRLESPFRGHFRITTTATELGGVTLPAGARLMLLWGAANRAADVHHPDTVDLDRADPRSHTAFGRGIHFCLGAHLARLETTRAVTLLLAATETIAPTPGTTPAHVPSLMVRRLTSLPLTMRA